MGSERSPFLLFFCSHSWKTKNGNCNSNRVNTDRGGGEHLSVFRGVGPGVGGGGDSLFCSTSTQRVIYSAIVDPPVCVSPFIYCLRGVAFQ